MEQYISKSALVEEIDKRKIGYNTDGKHPVEYNTVKKILDILDTLEVKDVDLEKEIENILEKEKAFVTDNREVKYYNGDSFNHIYELEFIAKHFFELGMAVSNKLQKGE